MSLETQASCGAAEYGKVARANFQQIETRLAVLEAGASGGEVVTIGAVSYTAAVGDVVIASPSSGTATVTLPTATDGQKVTVLLDGAGTVAVKTDPATTLVTLTGDMELAVCVYDEGNHAWILLEHVLQTGFFDDAGDITTFSTTVADGSLVTYDSSAKEMVPFNGSAAGSAPAWSGSEWLETVYAANSQETIVAQLRVENSSEPAAGYDQWAAMSITGYSYDAGGKVKWEWFHSVETNASGPQCDYRIGYKQAGGALQTRLHMQSAGNNTFTGTLTASLGIYAAKLACSGDPGSGTASRLTFTNATVAAGEETASFENFPAGYSVTPTYLKAYSGTTAGIIPFFAVDAS